MQEKKSKNLVEGHVPFKKGYQAQQTTHFK